MSPLQTSLVAFTSIFGGTFLGIFVRRRLPDRHLSGETRDIVRQGTGLIATLASLVLGLLIASASGKFETESSQVEQLTANVVLLDGILKLYGPETDGTRALLRREVALMADRIWRENDSGHRRTQTFEPTDLGISLYNEVLKLSPETDAQRFLQAKAMDAITDAGKIRLLLFTTAGGSIPIPFLIVLIGWLTLIFASISLFAESSTRAIAVLCIFSLAATAAIFLILELSQPFTGLMRISDQPLRNALPAAIT
jgi:Protein of unknown function (DUF4239)